MKVQERLTQQIADALIEAVGPLGVAVVVEAE
jgi:GTP cyclohydrolase I